MERIQETDEGYYEQSGDVLEWRWKDEPTPASKTAEPKPASRRAKARARRVKK